MSLGKTTRKYMICSQDETQSKRPNFMLAQGSQSVVAFMPPYPSAREKMMALRRMIKARNESSFRVRGSNFRHVICRHNRDLKDTSNERTTLRRRVQRRVYFHSRYCPADFDGLSFSGVSSISGTPICADEIYDGSLISRKEKRSFLRADLINSLKSYSIFILFEKYPQIL